jgi:hypothetical protein
MKCRRLVKVGSGVEAYWDITGGHGLANYATGDEATLQSVRCELHLLLGEWFLDVTRGVPWWRHPNAPTAKPVLGRFPADLPYAEAAIKAAILRVPGVSKLTSFSINFNHATRAASCKAGGTLASGEGFTVQETIP